MKFYLSSYRLGSELNSLRELVRATTGPFGYVPNALDFTDADPKRKQQHIERELGELEGLGINVELLDLRVFFGRESELDAHLRRLGGVYVCGGNSFVLRQAMHISGFDVSLRAMITRSDFLYAGYSAGVCVLGPTMRAYAIVDDPMDMPYSHLHDQIWEGLGILSFTYLPHYHSDHADSPNIDKEIQHCIEHKILFKAYRDGEVLIAEKESLDMDCL